MINTNYTPKAEKSMGAAEKIPAGGYVAKILGAKVEEYSWGDVLVVSFDIAEGDYKDFFTNQYKADTREDKKWKGAYRLNIPTDKSKYPESDRKGFNNFIFALKYSNKGYEFVTDESKLKGNKMGVLFRNKEFMKDDGTTGWFSDCCAVCEIEEIKNGTFKMPKDKPLTNSAQTTIAPSTSAMPVEDDIDDDLPF